MNTRIPETGRPHQDLLAEMKAMKTDDAQWHQGRTWSMVYHVDDEHKAFLQEAAQQFFSESYINPFAFKSLQRMELEVIGMARDMLHGDESVVGTMTSGGTESIFMAVYAYREWAKKHHSVKGTPEIVVPETIHPAFEKAAYIQGIRIRKTAITSEGKADLGALSKAIGPNTILLAVSAPSYPHGLLDPIAEAAQLARAHGLPLHVDACIGGFMLPWVERLRPGTLPAWDFRIEGVTSMSADTHKFGYGSKGSSVLLYRDMGYLRHQFFITTDWQGGIYASATLLGSRAGGPIATAWASLNTLGQEGFLRITRAILAGVEQLQAGIASVPELKLIGEPCMNIIAYTSQSKSVDIFVVADYLAERGWYVDRQQRPNCIHLTVMQHNLATIPQYLLDLRSGTRFAQENPKAQSKGNAALYGLMARLPFRSMVANNVRQLFEQLYGNEQASSISDDSVPAGQSMPDPPKWMGWLNRILARLPGRR